MENQLHDLLEQIFTDGFEIVQTISEPTKKWSGHSRCEDMELLFSRDREIVVMKSYETPKKFIKPDHQLSLARWLRNEVPAGSTWSPDEQTLHHVTLNIGKACVEVVVILSKKLEVALDTKEKKAA